MQRHATHAHSAQANECSQVLCLWFAWRVVDGLCYGLHSLSMAGLRNSQTTCSAGGSGLVGVYAAVFLLLLLLDVLHVAQAEEPTQAPNDACCPCILNSCAGGAVPLTPTLLLAFPNGRQGLDQTGKPTSACC
jgi:hypothetical protein